MPRARRPPPAIFLQFSEFPKFRRIFGNSATPEHGTRNGSLVFRFWAPGRRIRAVAISTSPGPISGANRSRVSIFGLGNWLSRIRKPRRGFLGNPRDSRISETRVPKRVGSIRVPGSWTPSVRVGSNVRAYSLLRHAAGDLGRVPFARRHFWSLGTPNCTVTPGNLQIPPIHRLVGIAFLVAR